MNITFERLSLNKLHKDVWSFWLNENILYLDYYQELDRISTKKRSWNLIKQYQRIGRPRDYYNSIHLTEVPYDESIGKIAKNKLIEILQVKLWDK